MYYGLPIVVTAYPDFVADFGENIDFGAYTDGKVDNLVECLRNIIKSKTYSELCTNAHRAVADFTWNNYVDDFLRTLKDMKARNTIKTTGNHFHSPKALYLCQTNSH